MNLDRTTAQKLVDDSRWSARAITYAPSHTSIAVMTRSSHTGSVAPSAPVKDWLPTWLRQFRTSRECLLVVKGHSQGDVLRLFSTHIVEVFEAYLRTYVRTYLLTYLRPFFLQSFLKTFRWICDVLGPVDGRLVLRELAKALPSETLDMSQTLWTCRSHRC